MTTTPGGLLLVLAVLVPFVGVLAGLVLGGRNPQRVALVTLVLGLGLAIALADAYDMLFPGLVVFLHMQPSMSEEVTISDRGWIFRQPAIVAPDRVAGG